MKNVQLASDDLEERDGDAHEKDCDDAGDGSKRETADDSLSGFHRMFDTFFSGKHPFFCPEGRAWNPPTDIFETRDALHIKIEVAGLKEKDIQVKVNKDYLIIRGRRTDEHRQSHARFHLMEIHYGSFERVLKLPHPVDVDKIAATLQHGFLMVTVPRDASLVEYVIEIE